ncbi:hypothetical protein [Zhouia amylolytica]|uniref:hypothetical protein n=1 Tax=Zhouia amylolytica TaxID=376730 RepID=UPI0037449F6A
MNPQKIYILFVLKKQKLNKKGLAPLYCRLTYNKKRICNWHCSFSKESLFSIFEQ